MRSYKQEYYLHQFYYMALLKVQLILSTIQIIFIIKNTLGIIKECKENLNVRRNKENTKYI